MAQEDNSIQKKRKIGAIENVREVREYNIHKSINSSMADLSFKRSRNVRPIPTKYERDTQAKCGAYFLALNCYCISGLKVCPSEVSLRWTDGVRAISWIWYMTCPTILDDREHEQYRQSKVHVGLTASQIKAQKDAITSHKDMMHRLMHEFSRQETIDCPIYCSDEDMVKLWTTERVYTSRLLSCDLLAGKDLKLITQDRDSNQGTALLWDVARHLSINGVCTLHIPYSPNMNCAHRTTLQMQQIWNLKKDVFKKL